jgi:hypothetical protein
MYEVKITEGILVAAEIQQLFEDNGYITNLMLQNEKSGRHLESSLDTF